MIRQGYVYRCSWYKRHNDSEKTAETTRKLKGITELALPVFTNIREMSEHRPEQFGFTHLFDEFHRLLPFDRPDGADFLVVEQNAVELVCSCQHLGPEGGRDKLRRSGKLVDHSW